MGKPHAAVVLAGAKASVDTHSDSCQKAQGVHTATILSSTISDTTSARRMTAA